MKFVVSKFFLFSYFDKNLVVVYIYVIIFKRTDSISTVICSP